MKKIFLIILIVLFTFGFASIGCNDTNDENDPYLNGTWASDDYVGTEINFNNGAYTILEGNKATERGTYSTNDNKITIQTTEIDAYGFGHLVDRDKFVEIETTTKDLPYTAERLNELFPTFTDSYFIDGRKLFIIKYDERGVEIDKNDIYTRK